MPPLFWNPPAITLLVEFVLLSLFSIYIGYQLIVAPQAGHNKHISVLLLAVFAASAIAAGFQFASHALHPDYVDYFLPWVSPFASAAMTAFVLFAFRFKQTKPRRNWTEIVLATALVAITCLETYIGIMRVALLADGHVEYRDAWIDTPFTLGFFLALPLFARTVRSSISRVSGLSYLRSLVPTLVALCWLPTRLDQDGAAARAFFYVALMPFLIGLVLLLRSYDLLTWNIAEPLALLFFLLTFLGYALVYLNYVPERTSFLIKLVGISLTSVLFVFCGISWLIGGVYVDEYENENLLPSRTAIRFEPQADGAYLAARTGFRFETELGERLEDNFEPIPLPFEFPFYGEQHSEIFARYAGFTSFDGIPVWRNIQHEFGPHPAIFLTSVDLEPSRPKDTSTAGSRNADSGMFIRREPGEVVITWNKLTSPFSQKDEYTFQLKLYPTGVIEMVYADIPIKPKADIYRANQIPMMVGIVPPFRDRQVSEIHFAKALPFIGAPGGGIMENYRLDYLQHLDLVYAPVAYFTLAATLFMLIAFPLFFQVNINRQLQHLIDGVQQILNGKLTASIRVFYHDELGFLASSFNAMAKAQSELIQTLEDKVAERSAQASEYAARNARLEERDHLSRELHDAVSQTLFSANLIADTLPGLWERDPVRAKAALLDVQRFNKDALAEMRQLLLELSPRKLTAYPLGRLLQHLVDDIQRTHHIDVTVEIERDATLPDDVQLTFYRIGQECIWNAVKHAAAKTIRVYFDGMKTQAMLTVSDDGKGFDPDAVAPGHLGLQIMRERMTKIEGSLEIESRPGHGTSTTAIWIENALE